MSVNYSAGLSSYEHKGKCGMPEIFDTIDLEKKCHQLVDLIQTSKLTVVHSGAGISTSAGIPDFRGPKGVWTLEKKGKSPECSITFDDAIPTFSHRLLVILEKLGLIQFVVSQNVDGLHIRSGFPRDRLAELHGNMFTQICQLCNREAVMDHVSPTMGLKPTGEKCPYRKKRGSCRGLLRDTILDWEDALPDDQLELAERFCKSADLSIVIGSSLQIVPAANLPLLTKRNQGKLVIINLQPTKHDKKADLLIHGRADDVLKMVAEGLKISVPDFTGPGVCLTSSNPMPELLSKSKKIIVRKRKHEQLLEETFKSEHSATFEVKKENGEPAPNSFNPTELCPQNRIIGGDKDTGLIKNELVCTNSILTESVPFKQEPCDVVDTDL